MSTSIAATNTLFTVALRRGAAASAGVRAAAVVSAAALTAAAAQFSVHLPYTAVPLTLQPMAVLVCGAVLGRRLGFQSQILYLVAGLAGLPVFAASPLLPQGTARLLGPTAGYLVGFPLGTWVAGYFAERGFDRRYATSFAAMAAGLAVIFAVGVTWLAVWPVSPMGFDAALRAGLYPFVAPDLVKLAAAAAVLPTLWRFIGPALPKAQ
jgi:biotin transport system substrate-specific component